VDLLEQVLAVADQYLHLGMDEHEHTQLVKLIDKANKSEPPIGL
jgi:hypothetical protein